MERAVNLGTGEFQALLAATQPSSDGEFGDRLFAELVRTSPIDRIALVAAFMNRLALARIRPDIVFVSTFWPAGDAERADLIAKIGESRFDLESALRVFGRTIGPRTISVLFNNMVGDFSPTVASSLIENDEAAVRETVAAWIVSLPSRLAATANLGMGRRAAETLAGALVRHGAPIVEPEVWGRLIMTTFTDVPSSIGALNAVGFLAAIALSDDISTELGRLVYDPLQRLVRAHQLSTAEDNYLVRHISRFSNSWSLKTALVQSALSRWPPTTAGVGALVLSAVPEHQNEIVDELWRSQGRRGLEVAMAAGPLPVHVQERIRKKLERTPSGNPFSWLLGGE
jgi:hypothetical protein